MKHTKPQTISFFLMAFVLCLGLPSFAQREPESTPEETYQKAINNPAFEKAPDGEGFCWQARGAMGQFISSYKQTKNTEWLDAGVKYYDWLVGKMAASPDGYKGWVGAYLSDKKYWQDVLVGDALLTEGLLNFAILVRENEELKSKYKAKADSYVQLAEKHFYEKYDKRGTWIDDGSYGAYIGSTQFLDPGASTTLRATKNITKGRKKFTSRQNRTFNFTMTTIAGIIGSLSSRQMLTSSAKKPATGCGCIPGVQVTLPAKSVRSWRPITMAWSSTKLIFND